MGFFSQDCHGCGHPLLRLDATNAVNFWMIFGVSISRDGTIVQGVYDGYGNLILDDESEEEIRCVGNDFNDDGSFAGTGPTVWHRACWVAAGSPAEWQGESESSDDQGWFFGDGAHDMAEPKPQAVR